MCVCVRFSSLSPRRAEEEDEEEEEEDEKGCAGAGGDPVLLQLQVANVIQLIESVMQQQQEEEEEDVYEWTASMRHGLIGSTLSCAACCGRDGEQSTRSIVLMMFTRFMSRGSRPPADASTEMVMSSIALRDADG